MIIWKISRRLFYRFFIASDTAEFFVNLKANKKSVSPILRETDFSFFYFIPPFLLPLCCPLPL